jgi:hypothetical protein
MEKKYFSSQTRVVLYIADYPWYFSFLGVFSMALFKIPLSFDRNVKFYKLMGCGKNGSFDIQPDLKKWALMVFFESSADLTLSTNNLESAIPGKFIRLWWRLFQAKTNYFVLEPFTGHGSWDGFSFKQTSEKIPDCTEKVAVLTRASIRFSKAIKFWKAVPHVSKNLASQPGLKFTIGIGEIPFFKQATFSVWDSIESIKNYAYRQNAHKTIIQRTRNEKWYTEEMFIRFRVLHECQVY